MRREPADDREHASVRARHDLETIRERIHGEALRREMTALTAATAGDGSGQAARSGVLQLLKGRLADGRAIAERMLREDGSGGACVCGPGSPAYGRSPAATTWISRLG